MQTISGGRAVKHGGPIRGVHFRQHLIESSPGRGLQVSSRLPASAPGVPWKAPRSDDFPEAGPRKITLSISTSGIASRSLLVISTLSLWCATNSPSRNAALAVPVPRSRQNHERPVRSLQPTSKVAAPRKSRWGDPRAHFSRCATSQRRPIKAHTTAAPSSVLRITSLRRVERGRRDGFSHWRRVVGPHLGAPRRLLENRPLGHPPLPHHSNLRCDSTRPTLAADARHAFAPPIRPRIVGGGFGENIQAHRASFRLSAVPESDFSAR